MNWFWTIVFVAGAIFAGMFIEASKSKKGSSDSSEEKKENTVSAEDIKGHYQAKYLLTRNEWHEYKKLRQYAAAYQLQVCPKVRLLDIVEPRRGEHYMAYLGKIKSKHVDFLICDEDLHIKAVLELDDGSHDAADRKARDTLVDDILESVGYTVIHTRSVTEDTLRPLQPKGQE